MNLTLHQLRMLTQVRTSGTISAAAMALGYTASAVSQQLSVLESVVGTPILCRIGRRVQLTDAGYVLVRHAEAILRQVEAAQADLEQLRRVVAGRLEIGVLESLSTSILPDVLQRLRTLHPELEVRARQIAPEPGVEHLCTGEIDGAFVIGDPVVPMKLNDAIGRHLVCRDWFKIVVSEDDPLQGPTADLSELAGRPMIASDPRASCGRLLALACRHAGFEPNVVHQIDDYPSIFHLVASGAGVALVPDLALLNIPPKLRVIEMAEPVCRTVEFAFRIASASRPSIQAFRRVLDLVADQAGLDR